VKRSSLIAPSPEDQWLSLSLWYFGISEPTVDLAGGTLEICQLTASWLSDDAETIARLCPPCEILQAQVPAGCLWDGARWPCSNPARNRAHAVRPDDGPTWTEWPLSKEPKKLSEIGPVVMVHRGTRDLGGVAAIRHGPTDYLLKPLRTRTTVDTDPPARSRIAAEAGEPRLSDGLE